MVRGEDMGFVLDWQKKLGYKKDPFMPEPDKKISTYFVDREQEREKLNLFVIKQHRFGIVHGPKGVGKSTLVGWLQEQLGVRVRRVSFAGKVVTKPKDFFEQFLHESLNVVEKKVTRPQEKLKKDEMEPFLLQKLRKKRVLVIVDDAQLLVKQNKDLLKHLLEACPQSQVLLVLERVLKEHEHYGADQLKLALEDMSEAGLEAMLKRRIELAGGVGTYPFDKKEIQGLITKAKSNPVKLLELARERAIELSLKAGPPPKPKPKPKRKPVKKAPTPKASKEAGPVPETAEAEAIEVHEELQEEQQRVPEAKDKPKKWFSIKFVKDDEEEKKGITLRKADERSPTEIHKEHKQKMLKAARPKEPEKKQKDEHHYLDEELLSPSNEADAEMLSEIVEAAGEEIEVEQEVKKEKKQPEDGVEVEDVIQSLVKEMDKKG